MQITPAGSPADGPRQLLADRVSASLTVAAVFLVLAVIVTLIAHPRRRTAAAEALPVETARA
jgi:hypothetical protein